MKKNTERWVKRKWSWEQGKRKRGDEERRKSGGDDKKNRSCTFLFLNTSEEVGILSEEGESWRADVKTLLNGILALGSDLEKQRFFSGVSQWVGVEIEVWRWKAIEFAWFFLLLNVGFGFDSNWGVWGRGEILKEEWKIPNPSFALPSWNTG